MRYTSIYVIHLSFSNLTDCSLNTSNYGISIIYMNICVYIYLMYTLFAVMFLFDLKKMKTISDLKIFSKNAFISMTVVLIFLSISGIPPLAGFVGKFLLLNHIFLSHKYVYLIAFLFLNFFSIYFYIQNLRFLVSKVQQSFFLVAGYYLFFNKDLLNILVLLNVFNFFGILYCENILYFFLNVCWYRQMF